MKNAPNILFFKDTDKDDLPLVGGKGANLGEMLKAGFPVPDGFCVTAPAYFKLIKHNQLEPQIRKILEPLDVNKPEDLQAAAKSVQKLVAKVDIPQDISTDIIKAYHKLCGIHDKLVAVRSSATAEDLPDASFAGQQATFLNIKGEASLIEHIRLAWASLFTARAIFYRVQKHFDHFKVGIAVPVQLMVQAEVSGVMFTLDPVTNDKTVVTIESVWGLGETIVQGSVTPDHYVVDKKSLAIIQKTISEQDEMLAKKGPDTKEVKVPKKLQKKQKLSDTHIQHLAKIGAKLQQHYFFPQDIEWALEKNKLYIVQTRPVTTIGKPAKKKKKKFKPTRPKPINLNLPLLLKGDPASPGIGTGHVKIVKSPKQIKRVHQGDVLVAPMTSPDYVPAMRKAAAIVTDQGGQTSHAAIVSREMGVPAIVGTEEATKVLKSNSIITVNGTSGEVYKGAPKPGKLEQIKQETPAMQVADGESVRTATKIYVNLAEPDLAGDIGRKRVDGIGLCRAEFMAAELGVHPRKLLAEGKGHVYTNKLAEGLETFCRAFDPRPVVYRANDFKTNEYRNLRGGKAFEQIEPNPMLGFRGAYRYITDPKVFELELEALKKVRDQAGFKNLSLMIPYVHTPKELVQVKRIVSGYGLYRSPTFKFWMMVEVPSNVVLLEDFIHVGIDGVSIGTNDLTMLMLGADRDNEDVSEVLDPLNPAVLWALEKTITTCNKHKVTSSICGQAPSIFPDLNEMLVKWGITSISVNPDMIDHTRQLVHFHEDRLVKKK